MTTMSCPPGIGNSALATVFGSYEAIVRGVTDYWTGALARLDSPADLAADAFDWWALAAHRERPQWATEHTVVAEWPVARLRDFSDPDSRTGVATLFFPPPQSGTFFMHRRFRPREEPDRNRKKSRSRSSAFPRLDRCDRSNQRRL